MTMDVNQLPPDKKVDTSFLKKPIKTKNRDEIKVPFGENQESSRAISSIQNSSIENQSTRRMPSKYPNKNNPLANFDKQELIESILIGKAGHLNTLYYLIISKMAGNGVLDASHSKLAAGLCVQKKSVGRILKDLTLLKMISCHTMASPTTSAKYLTLIHTKEDALKWAKEIACSELISSADTAET